MPGLVRIVPWANDDVDVPVEQGDESDEPLGRKTTQLVVPEVGDVRLRNTESLRDRSLTQPLFVDQFVQANRELDTKLPVLRIGKAKVSKDVSGAGYDRFTLFSPHTSPRSLPRPPGADRESGSQN